MREHAGHIKPHIFKCFTQLCIKNVLPNKIEHEYMVKSIQKWAKWNLWKSAFFDSRLK